MKYDFSTYILNSLNEKDEEQQQSKKPYSTADEIKTKLNDFILDKGVVKYKDKTGKPGDKVSVDTLKEIKNGEGWKDYYKNNKSNDMIKTIIKTTTEQENKNNTIRAFDEDGFNLLGKTIAYRSALTFMNVANTSGEDFKQAAIDAFKDESEYSVKQLENLDSLLDYSAALKTIKNKEKRLNDENNKDNDKVLAKLKETETQLVSPYKYSAIQEVKKTYGKEFQDNRDIFQKSFNDGMATQKEEMSKPDYKWEDPVTKLPPKGFSAKANVVGDKLFKKLEAGAKKADEWIKQQKGLDWAILKLCSLGVHGLVYGGKALYKLLGKVYKRTNLKDSLRFTKKYKEVETQIDIFKKEYDEWANNKSKNKDNKEGQEGQENTEQNSEQNKEDENAKNTILMKFSELLNNYVVPYYYSKLSIIVACVENIDNKYIIRQENNKWSTLNTSTGNLTIIEDNAILAQRMLETVNKKLQDAFNSFGDDPCADAFKSIPQDLKFNSTYSSNYLKWIDKIKEGKIDKEKLKNLLKVYNDKIVKIQFGSYKEFFDYINNAKVAYKECSFPTVKEITIKFNGDEDGGVPGIVTGAKKGENQEEEKPPVTEEVAKEALNNVKYNDGNVYIKYSEYNGTKDFNVSFNKENAEKKEHLEGFTDVYSKYKDVFEEWVKNNKDNKDLQEPINIMKIALGYNNNEEKKEETQEKSKEEVRQKITEIEKKVNDDLNSLKDINELEKLTAQFIELSKDVDNNYSAIYELNKTNLDTQKQEKLNTQFKDANHDIFNKMLYINLSKKMNEVQSAVYNKVMFYLLLESEENGEQDSYDKLISVLTKDISLENIDKIKEVYNAFAKEMIEWYNSLNDEQKAAIEKFKNDPLALYLARKTLKKPKEENQDEKPKEEKNEEHQEKSGENNQES
jgi:hypothetical protein